MYPQALQNKGSHNDYHLFITFCYNSIQFFLHNSQFCLKKTDCSLYKHNKDSEMFTIYHILSMASSVVKQDEVTKFCLETELGLPVVYSKKKKKLEFSVLLSRSKLFKMARYWPSSIVLFCFVNKFVLGMIMDWNYMLAHKHKQNKSQLANIEPLDQSVTHLVSYCN